MFRIALAATLAIVIEAAYLQSQTGEVNMREACRDLSEVDCNNKVFCDWRYSGRGDLRRGRCRVDSRFA